jgi:hypothetical protein
VGARLRQIQIGMTAAEVRALIGPPKWVKTSQTTAGRLNEWYYDELQILRFVKGEGAAMYLAFQRGQNINTVKLELENDILIRTEGF